MSAALEGEGDVLHNLRCTPGVSPEELRAAEVIYEEVRASDCAFPEEDDLLETEEGDLPAPARGVLDIWKREQSVLKKRLEVEDRLTFDLNAPAGDAKGLRLVGGVDISFVKESNTTACAALVVCSFPSFEVVYEAMEMIELTQPYIAGYLAFRECPFLEKLISDLKTNKPELFPQVIMTDGNGLLHPRSFGLACQLGVVCDVPTLGIGKNLLIVDGLTMEGVRQESKQKLHVGGDMFPLVGVSGATHGMALLPKTGGSKPVFVSIGHRMCLETAVQLTLMCAKFRVPEPVRQADLRSRQFLRDMKAE